MLQNRLFQVSTTQIGDLKALVFNTLSKNTSTKYDVLPELLGNEFVINFIIAVTTRTLWMILLFIYIANKNAYGH